MEHTILGQVIGGDYARIIMRNKSDQTLEIGQLVVCDVAGKTLLLQVCDLFYGSQLSPQNLELIAGMNLEESTPLDFFEKELRNYSLAKLKNILTIGQSVTTSTTIPPCFTPVRSITAQDLSFLSKPQSPMHFGNVRSGQQSLDLPVYLEGNKVLSHHVLIAGTTGRGKSVLISNLLWGTIDQTYCGYLVLDPHDEYYGRAHTGMKDHPETDRIVYYTPTNPPSGAKTLAVNLATLKPQHFDGAVEFSDPQKQALILYYKYFGNQWIQQLLLERKIEGVQFREETISVVKRKLMYVLDLELQQDSIVSKGIFGTVAGANTVSDIVSELLGAKTVIVDTSHFAGAVEILVGSMIATELFNTYRYYKMQGSLENKPVVNIVLEEAPRVLGKEALERGSNIFSTIAREGRKFKVGLTAITQLPSLIPRDILANINTKIILGTEMKPERTAIIESAAQDLSDDDRTIAALGIGQALVSSNFAKFAIPIHVPYFDTIVKEHRAKTQTIKTDFDGVKVD